MLDIEKDMMRTICFTALFCIASVVFAQKKDVQGIIASSQTGASDIFFKAGLKDPSKINLESYQNLAETNIRKGLPYFFVKAKQGKPLRIAYIGGSITRADHQYRNQSFSFIQGMFPNTAMVGINAGVSGTDTDLGACRLYDHVLKYNPDLIFIEFAVNGGYPQGMEGIVRQIIQYNNIIDICFIYTLTAEQFIYYQQNTFPPVIKKLEEIADHYNVPSVHMGMEVTELEATGKLISKGKTGESSIPLFSIDGVHPLQKGGDLYAASIARSMLRMKGVLREKLYTLPKPLYPDNWEEARMIDPERISFSENWQKIDPSNTHLKTYKSWFPYIMTSEKGGESLTFRYRGKAFGIFDIGAPETGQLDIYVDGKFVNMYPVKGDRLYSIDSTSIPNPLKRFNSYCNNRTRGQYFLVQTPDGGEHTVTFKISQGIPDKRKILGAEQQEDINNNFEKYNHNRIYVGKILLNGELLPYLK